MNNLNLIVGNDSKLIDFHLNDILSKIDYLEENKISYDMNVASLSDILDEASMISLFGDVKVIIGNNFNISETNDNDMEYLSGYINNLNKNVYIIFIASKVDARMKEYKIFKDNFKIIDLSKVDNDSEIINYVKNTIKNNGYICSDSDIDYFISKVGNDINNINNEINKLFIYKIDDKKINMKDIDLLVISNIDNVMYEFTNAVFDNDYDKITRMYSKFKQDGIGIDYLLVTLNNSFRQALIMKKLSNDGESNASIAKIIGKKEFYVKKSLERLYRYTESDIAKFISKLAVIDREYKSGKSNVDMLELFLLDKESTLKQDSLNN